MLSKTSGFEKLVGWPTCFSPIPNLPAAWDAEFELVVMTGHAFQVFIDDELRQALASIREAKWPFRVRDSQSLRRAWEAWDAEVRGAVDGPQGAKVRMSRKVAKPFDGRVWSWC